MGFLPLSVSLYCCNEWWVNTRLYVCGRITAVSLLVIVTTLCGNNDGDALFFSHVIIPHTSH